VERRIALLINGVHGRLAGEQRLGSHDSGEVSDESPLRCHVERRLAILIFVAVRVRAGQQEVLDFID
jgi:hypothetical protein